MTLPDGTLHEIERQLLDELESVDPAVSQADSAGAWLALVEQSGDLVRVKPADGEWSALDVLAHLTVVELTNALRYRAMLAEDGPTLSDFGVSTWSSVLKGTDIQPPALLGMFRALRYDNLAFWEHLDAAGRARLGIHPEYGPESIELRFKMLAGHARMHLAQGRRAVAAARSRSA